MLIQFSIRNFKTFKEKATLSFVASNYDKSIENLNNISTSNNYRLKLLKSAVIFGSNASGKSKFIEALMFMKVFVINSFMKSQKGDRIFVDPFRLDTESENQPSEFEIIFIYKNIMYRYGFEADKNKITAEWLYYKPKNKEIELYYRTLQNIEKHSRSFSKEVITIANQLVRENTLLISLAAQLNDKIASDVIYWFNSLSVISGLQEYEFKENSIEKIKTSIGKAQFLTFLKNADLGIEDLIYKEINSGDFKNKPFTEIIFKKNKFSKKIKIEQIEFWLSLDESEGTKKYFYLLGPIIDSLENGSPLFIDELDSKLHPNLVCKIISLFNSKNLNPKNAQLIFNSHDTNLLRSGLFRKDQVWFTEKDKYGEAKLYSLSDFKSNVVRNKEDFENNYLRGKYGAIPFLEYFDQLTNNTLFSSDEVEK